MKLTRKMVCGLAMWVVVVGLGVWKLSATFIEVTAFTQWMFGILFTLHVADKASQSFLQPTTKPANGEGGLKNVQ